MWPDEVVVDVGVEVDVEGAAALRIPMQRVGRSSVHSSACVYRSLI
jgi:hypothetical protein